MIRLSLSIALLAFMSGATCAQAIIITKAGYYLVDDEGRISKATKVIRVDVDEPDDPDDPEPEDLRGKVAVWTKQVDDKVTAQALVQVYDLAVDTVSKGELDPPTKIMEFVKQASDAVIEARDAEARWGPWREKVSGELTKLAQQGKFSSVAHVSQALEAIRDGLDDGSPLITDRTTTDPAHPGIFDNFDLEKLIELIKLIIEIFKMFSI